MQSGAPSHKYWIEMHLPSIGQRNGSNALHFVSKIKWFYKLFTNYFITLLHTILLPKLCFRIYTNTFLNFKDLFKVANY